MSDKERLIAVLTSNIQPCADEINIQEIIIHIGSECSPNLSYDKSQIPHLFNLIVNRLLGKEYIVNAL